MKLRGSAASDTHRNDPFHMKGFQQTNEKNLLTGNSLNTGGVIKKYFICSLCFMGILPTCM